MNPAIMREPKVLEKAIERLRQWHPQTPPEYSPGYEFKERLTQKEAEEAAKSNREEFLHRMGDMATLLQDAEYFAAFRAMQGRIGERPSKEEMQKSMDTLKRIEKEKGLKGVASK